MATKSVDQGSGKEKMKLKSLLLRYYPPGTGRASSVPPWGPWLWPWEAPGRRRVRGLEVPSGVGGPLVGDPVGGRKPGASQHGPSLLWLLDTVARNILSEFFRNSLNIEVAEL